jgi:hypothetical protein
MELQRIKMTTFWDIAPCSPVEETGISETCTASIFRVMMMEAVCTSETPICFNETV